MNIEIKIPPLGESITEATIIKWYKKSNELVITDELLLELETEKVALEIHAPKGGVLEIYVEKNSIVKVGQIVGQIKYIESLYTKQTSYPHQSEINNLSSGNLSKNNSQVVNATNTQKESVETNEKPIERVLISPLRKIIAQRLKKSQNTAAILSSFNEIDMTNVIDLRKKYNNSFKEGYGVKLGFMSFFTKVVCQSLRQIPSINTEIEGDYIIYKKYYDIGIAIGTEKGLVVPVIHNANRLSFAEIENQIVLLSSKAQQGKLSIQDLRGGTFSITNGGVYGSLLSTPIINPPQTAILGLHAIKERPVAISGKVKIRPMMYIALSYDHRIIDGKDAIAFLLKIKETIENPEKLLLGL